MLLYSNIPCLQNLQGFRLEFVATDEFSTRVGGVKIGANHINGVSLSLVLRMSLGQPIIAGPDTKDFYLFFRVGDARNTVEELGGLCIHSDRCSSISKCLNSFKYPVDLLRVLLFARPCVRKTFCKDCIEFRQVLK
jgi:hypothetical protein